MSGASWVRALRGAAIALALASSAGCASGDVVNEALWRRPSRPLGSSGAMATGSLALLEPPRVEAYVLGPQDVLTIEVLDLRTVGEFYTQSSEIDLDGCVTLPLIGRLQAAGVTPGKLREKLIRALGDNYLHDPQVAVTVREFRSKRVGVLGAVLRPGVVVLQRNATTVLEAVALAGGLIENSGRRAVLVRKGSETIPPAVHEVDVEALSAGDTTQNFTVFPGDVLQVMPADRYFVSGFVTTPGEYKLGRTTTLLEAIAIAGGLITPDASPDMVRIRRADQPPVEVDLTLVAEGQAPDLLIEPGDIIEVRQGFWRGVGLGLFRFIKNGIGFGYNLATLVPPI